MSYLCFFYILDSFTFISYFYHRLGGSPAVHFSAQARDSLMYVIRKALFKFYLPPELWGFFSPVRQAAGMHRSRALLHGPPTQAQSAPFPMAQA